MMHRLSPTPNHEVLSGGSSFCELAAASNSPLCTPPANAG